MGHGMDRVRFITHRGKRVLLIDSSYCTPEQGIRNANEALLLVTAEPLKSVLTLIDITGATISRESVTRTKEVTLLNRPYIKRSALVGDESLPKVFYEAIKRFSQREFPRFKTREEALDWLIAEERLAAS
jgi:hypothetical protein